VQRSLAAQSKEVPLLHLDVLDGGADLVTQRPTSLGLDTAQRAFRIAGLELPHDFAKHPDPGCDQRRKAVESILLDAVVGRERAQCAATIRVILSGDLDG
jgi:hypothetical protein